MLAAMALIFAWNAQAQDAKQRAIITRDYDQTELTRLQKTFADLAKTQKAAALEAAQKNGWPVKRQNRHGGFEELMYLDRDGNPIYFATDNVNAAKTTRANHLHSGGTLGLNLNGQGMHSGVWDGNPVRTTHQEFGGRVTVGDGDTTVSSESTHATHVTGTIAAAGVQANAKGMAPQSTVTSHEWNSDLAEATAAAANGLLLSNHSYGVPVENAPNWMMGAYSFTSRAWDQLAYNAPYYLMVASAGNDGNQTNPAPMTAGYDKLTGNKVSKNNLVVANCQDANVDTQGNLVSVNINSSSSEGPADDRRIKPDITGNGSSVTSSTAGSDSSYGSLSGTSMASPNVMGTLILVQQHYNNVNNRFMRAATLKALACHTADDRGKTGPDPVWGWGVLNAKRAAQAISQNGQQSWISEEVLQQGQTFSFTAVSDGTNPLLASICWTDPAGAALEGSTNNATPSLVNDLDIRITQNGNTYYPWKLQQDANQPAINTEDNNVDNVERININAAAGTYTITVTHKGTLVNGPQRFAFVVTGLSSAFSVTPISDDQTACLDGNATYNFNFSNSGTAAVNLSATGLPNGAVATFSPASISASGQFSMMVSNLQNAVPGVYNVQVVADNGTEIETRTISLKVSSTDFSSVVPVNPIQGQTGVATTAPISWQAVANADAYHVQIALDESFSNIVAQADVTQTAYTATGLTEGTNYFWRVFPKNSCGQSAVASVFSFQTGTLVCNGHFEATDFSNAGIADTAFGLAIIQIPVTGGMTIGDINVSLNISHTYIGDCTVELQAPASLGLQKITLLNEPCGDVADINCTLDDAATALACNNSAPGLSGFVLPAQALSAFNNKPADGTWTIYVRDPYDGDGGQVNFAALDICSIQPLLSNASFTAENFSVYPNPTTGTIKVDLGAHTQKAQLAVYDLQGRLVDSKANQFDSATLELGHLQNGVYLLTIEKGKQRSSKKIILSK